MSKRNGRVVALPARALGDERALPEALLAELRPMTAEADRLRERIEQLGQQQLGLVRAYLLGQGVDLATQRVRADLARGTYAVSAPEPAEPEPERME